MASSHAARQWLEAVKFSVYLVSPICATIFLGTGAYPYLESIIANVSVRKLAVLTSALLTLPIRIVRNSEST